MPRTRESSHSDGAGRVLVAYATAHGSTRSIAERLAARLREQGLPVDVLPVGAARDLRPYGTFVLGSAVHAMAWLPEALAFAHREARTLARRDVWLFSVGMPAALRGPWRTLAAQEEGRVIGGVGDVLHPRSHRLFSGVVRPGHLSVSGRLRFRAMGLRYGDYRDWNAVDGWAREIGRELLGDGD
ncbi:flavodoxin domain-containing protein [Streptomyces sp. NPDC090109]|uniref:flavodoxin domain-containing protein n=1 Tax=Streptomyces sp. NPDC090109 TaxID=3365948 RepID=UPI0037FC1FC1